MSIHKPNSQCVITRSVPDCELQAGVIVTVGRGHTLAGLCVDWGRWVSPVAVVQEILDSEIGKPPDDGFMYSHPVEWMRPINEDTDESDDEVIAAYRSRPTLTVIAVDGKSADVIIGQVEVRALSDAHKLDPAPDLSATLGNSAAMLRTAAAVLADAPAVVWDGFSWVSLRTGCVGARSIEKKGNQRKI